MAKVSIIIPVYNAEKYIAKCLDSLLNQTLDDIEIILVDDASSDKSFEIMATYEEKFPTKIKLIKNEKNCGAATSRNIGLNHVTGEFTSYLDSDDFLSENSFEAMVNACEFTKAPIARINRKLIFKGLDLSFLIRSKNYSDYNILYPDVHPTYLAFESPCCTGKMFKTTLIEDERFKDGLKWEDYPYTYPILLKADKVVTIPNAWYYYMLNPEGTTVSDSRRINSRMLDIFTCSDIVGKRCLTEDMPENISKQISYVQKINCLQRLRDVLYSAASIKDKKELMNLISSLIEVKYGPWQDDELYLRQKASNQLYGLRMNIIENHFLDRNNKPQDSEEVLKQKIKTKLEQQKKATQ